jgi:signal-transduction protein with cAMP-binding, CBS, and nucleotidyltransferase domain
VLGNGARWESALRTDQDHVLVLADDPPQGAGDWFAYRTDLIA